MVMNKISCTTEIKYVIMMNPILEGSCQKISAELARLPIERVRKGESAARLAPS